MPKTTMYAGINNSPQTVTTAEITATAQAIPVDNIGVFPAGPNLATLGTGDDAEVVQYTAAADGQLTGCVRGFGGTTAKIWPADTVLYRAFTLEDYRRLCANIDALFSEKMDSTGAASNATVAFTAASSRGNVATGETLAVIVGKLAKWYADLKSVAWSGSYNDLADKPQTMTPSNHASSHNTSGNDPITPASIGAQNKIETSGILKGDGEGGVTQAQPGQDYQAAITAAGLLKGAGNGAVSAAQAGTDYQAPITHTGLLKGTGSGVVGAQAGDDYQAPISAIGLLKGNGNGSVSSAVVGEDYQAPITATGMLKSTGNGNIAQAQAGTDYAIPSKSYNITLAADAWSDGLQIVTLAAMTSTANGTVGLADNMSEDQVIAAYAAMIKKTGQSNGALTFRCYGSVPIVDIPVTVTIWG